MGDDNEVLHAWRRGDATAGQTLMARHFDAIYRFFRSKLSGDIDDLVQATFLGCIEATAAEAAQDVRALLYTIARRRLADYLRRRYREREQLDWNEVSLHDLGTTPTGAIARQQAHALLAAAMHRLPLDWQIALELIYWEQLPTSEVATILEIEEATVRSRLARARARLREELVAITGSQDLAELEQLLPRGR